MERKKMMQTVTSSATDSSPTDCSLTAIEKLHLQLLSEPDIIFLFSVASSRGCAEMISEVIKSFPDCPIVGCSAAVAIEGTSELSECSVSMMACSFPKTLVQNVYVSSEDCPGEDDSPSRWFEYTGIEKHRNQQLIVFADPFSQDVEKVLKGLDYAYSCSVAGGFASSIERETVLFDGSKTVSDGMVIISLSGKVDVVPVLAQGCRPVGDVKVVTSCKGNALKELNGEPALHQLSLTASAVGEKERELMKQSLFLGVETGLMKTTLTKRDFLIRNIIGVNPEDESLLVGDHLHMNQSVRFHVRDPQSSREEMDDIIDRLKVKLDCRQCHGILLFSCLGRVKEFYGEEGVDAARLAAIAPDTVVGGFFCNGEIGQVAGETHIHGYTASALLFYYEGK